MRDPTSPLWSRRLLPHALGLPARERAAERFRRWLNEVGMFGHVGYAAYNDALAATRADLAAALGDPDGASRLALAQSATEGLNTLVAGLAIPQLLDGELASADARGVAFAAASPSMMPSRNKRQRAPS